MNLINILPIISDVAMPEPRFGKLSNLLDSPWGIIELILCLVVIIGMIILIKVMIDREKNFTKAMKNEPMDALGSSPFKEEYDEKRQEYLNNLREQQEKVLALQREVNDLVESEKKRAANIPQQHKSNDEIDR